MLLKRNLLDTITLVSCTGTLICILLNYTTNISPITGIWFPMYILLVFIITVSFSFKFIQWLLNLNKPLKYDVEDFVKSYPYLGFLSDILPKVPKKVERERKEYDTNDLSVISTVLERRLVSSWYLPYVSQEIGFPFACKQLLDQMIGRTFQICSKIETKDVYIDICMVLTTHLKEYKKAIKRHEKNPKTPIESHYKTSHPTSNTDKKNQTAEHCTNLLRIILKELVPWELWDTPHSELLVRILSKKLDNFIDNTLADPVWLNDKLMSILKGKKPKDDKQEMLQESKNENIELIPHEDIDVSNKIDQQMNPDSPKLIESALTPKEAQIQKDIKEDYEKPKNELLDNLEDVKVSDPIDIKSSPVLRQRRGRQGRNDVKIYDRVIEGAIKTWDTNSDLQCISLGQDLLASLNGEITLSRLWGQDPQDTEAGGDEEPMLDSKEPSPVKKEHSPKPAELFKDLQTTVHQAKTKIGDLQVPSNVVDVPNNDEAAGMMEGLLDFGIAGLKKGLRFTGLSDDLQEKHPLYKEKEKGAEKSPPAETKNQKTVVEQKEVISGVLRDDNGGNSVPPLVKQQRVSSQDSVIASLPKPIIKGEFPPLVSLSDSPEPEYEEAADLSTSIAKLRCLLQQRAEAGSERSSEDIWWEGAEETRGRTQQHYSSRPVDTAILADEYDLNAEKMSSPGQASNNMQRLDKLFHRTVTGVFNSIKTAVGAEGELDARASLDWTYVCTSTELSVGGAIARLVGSRRAYNHVDAALDSLEQLSSPPNSKEVAPEDFEEWCSACGAAWCAGAALACGAGLARGHLPHRAAALLFAELYESFLDVYLDEVSSWLRQQVFQVFQQLEQEDTWVKEMRKFDLEETCSTILEVLPVLQLFGLETATEAVKLTVSSLSHKSLNKDVIFRMLDLYALHFKNAAGLRNPSFDAN